MGLREDSEPRESRHDPNITVKCLCVPPMDRNQDGTLSQSYCHVSIGKGHGTCRPGRAAPSMYSTGPWDMIWAHPSLNGVWEIPVFRFLTDQDVHVVVNPQDVSGCSSETVLQEDIRRMVKDSEDPNSVALALGMHESQTFQANRDIQAAVTSRPGVFGRLCQELFGSSECDDVARAQVAAATGDEVTLISMFLAACRAKFGALFG